MPIKTGFFVFIIGVLPCLAAAPIFGPPIVLSFKNIKTRSEQRIVAFKLNISGAKIDALQQIPPGWLITISNNASGNVEVAGEFDVGAAALYPSQVQKIITIRRYLEEFQPFKIEMMIKLSGIKNYEDFDIVNLRESEIIMDVISDRK